MNRSVVAHPLVTSYLDRLRRQAAALPETRREELVEEIRSHLEVSLLLPASESQIRDMLDRLGTPEEIVDAELDDPRVSTARQAEREPLRRRDVAGLVLLLLGGGLLPPVGYLVGTALVGTSRSWSAPVRALLVGLPCVIALAQVVGFVRDERWYSPADLVSDPRGLLGDFLGIGLLALPYTAAQVALLIVVWLFFNHLGTSSTTRREARGRRLPHHLR
ncbi:HAAS signaling domain-containing protein [Actinosynnema sp. CS-041913]|uniref:HAAS signaling domain-containing protein n=1 Tax=Actinosynnema sp. CS-041913 TaxID=3239917 RepID=UPI003D8B07FA